MKRVLIVSIPENEIINDFKLIMLRNRKFGTIFQLPKKQVYIFWVNTKILKTIFKCFFTFIIFKEVNFGMWEGLQRNVSCAQSVPSFPCLVSPHNKMLPPSGKRKYFLLTGQGSFN